MKAQDKNGMLVEKDHILVMQCHDGESFRYKVIQVDEKSDSAWVQVECLHPTLTEYSLNWINNFDLWACGYEIEQVK